MRRARWSGVALTALLLAALVIGAVALIRGPQIPVASDTAVRQDVRAATEKFAAAINSYDVTDLDPYVEKVTPMLTEDLAEQFAVSTQDLLSQLAETEVVSHGTVEQVAIDSLDPDSAVALAAITVSTEPANLEFGRPRLRWRVELVREDDVWLVDNFASVELSAEAPTTPDAEDGS